MKVEEVNLPIPVLFQDIEAGKAFKYGFTFYMKLGEHLGQPYNAVTFSGGLVELQSDLPVIPVNAKVIVEWE